ncbi:MAG: metallophosphoesterase family protein [Coprococcus sp.]
MKVLLISDTHGKTSCIRQIKEIVGDVDMLVHMGDICGDERMIYDNFDCEIHMVAGNNDYGSALPYEEEFNIGRYSVFITHGHRYSVHYGTERLEELIKEKGYDIVMFGHTHERMVKHYGGSYIVNPGSLALPRDNRTGTYILLDFDQNGKPFFAENELPRRKSERESFWQSIWG